MVRVRRKSLENIKQQAVRTVSRLSGGYAQPVNYYDNKMSVDNSIYDSAKARRNRQRIERVVRTANRYAENIAKQDSRINEPYLNAKQYQGVQEAKNTKYSHFTYMGVTAPWEKNAATAAKSNSNG